MTPKKLTRDFIVEECYVSRKRPECRIPGSGALNIEVHIGRQQAEATFDEPDKIKYPIMVGGWALYLIDEDDYFQVVPKGSFKKLKKAAKNLPPTKG